MGNLRSRLISILIIAPMLALAVADFHTPCEKARDRLSVAFANLEKCLHENKNQEKDLSKICNGTYEALVLQFIKEKDCEKKASFIFSND